MKWVNIVSSGVTVLTFLAGKYGIAGIVLLCAKAGTSAAAATLAATTAKVIAWAATISSWAGIVSLVILGITLIYYLVSYLYDLYQKYKPKEYTQMADYAVDSRTINGKNVSVTYKAVRDNRNRIADLNGYEAQNGWLCLYTSTDPNSGSPIRADENGNVFNIVYGDSNNQKGYDCASFFGQVTPGNCNMGAKKDKVNGIYIHYYTEKSLKNRSDSTDPDSGEEIDDGTKLYYSDFVVMSGKTADIAKAKIVAKGDAKTNVRYEIFDQNLSPDARQNLEKEDQFTYIGYKTTTDPKQAVRDIRVAPFTPKGTVKFGEITYGCAGTLSYPADSKDEDEDYPADLDGLFYTTNENAGTPIEVGKLHLLTDHSQAEAGWEAVTTFSGLPYNFNTTRYNDRGTINSLKPGRLHVYAFNYTGYLTDEDYTWNNKKCYLYYEPEVKYTEGTKYLSGIFFAFGTDSDTGSLQSNISELFDTVSAIPNVEEADGSKGVNMAQSFFYKGYISESNQKYLRLYYSWSYNPYRALTDVQTFRGEPYVSSLPYTIEKALTYPATEASAAQTSASYVAATVVSQRYLMPDWIIRGISSENAYMAPNGLLGMNDQVTTGYSREAQGNVTFGYGQMPLLPTNLYVSGYVTGRTRLTLDDIVISQNRHDGENNNGTITADVSEELTVGGNKAEGDFCSVQDLKDPYNLSAFNLSYPKWTDDEGSKLTETEEKSGFFFITDKAPNDYIHEAGPSVFVYIKHPVVKKRYISRVFVGSSTRDDADSTDKDVLKGYDKQVDLSAMVMATSAGSDQVIPYNVAGDPSKAWYNYVKGGQDPQPPDGGDPAAYVSVARTDDPAKAIKGIVLYQSDADAVPEKMSIDLAVYYCASNTKPIRMADDKDYFIYYTYNNGAVPGVPITEIDISEAVFVSGHVTALVVDSADKTEIKDGKIVTTQRSKPYGDANLVSFIHAKYDISTGYFKKIYLASGETPREAQLGLLEQGCTEFCDIDLNKDAGGNSVYFGYKGFSLDENKISMASTEEARNKEKNKQLNEAVYDMICTVGEKFHPEGIISERYQIYYAPVARKDKNGNLVGTNLNDGTTGPEIYMYYTSTYAAKNNNDKAAKDQSIQLSSMPKDYLDSPITKIGFALYDYVPYSKELEAASSDNEDIIAWEYVMKSDNKAQVDLNEGAVSFDNDHLTTDNRITMFVQRETGNVKPSAEITGGYNTALVAESKLYLNK